MQQRPPQPARPIGATAPPASVASALRGGPSLTTFIVCLVGGGVLSIWLGTDRNWDLRNYQLYGPYALLHGRMLFDIVPAQVQTFFNPYLHLPHHVLFFALIDRPRVFAFAMGVPAGAFAFLMLRIAWEHVTQVLVAGPAAWLAVLVFGAMGLTGAAVLPGVGLSSLDVVVAAPLALAYLLVLRAVLARGAEAPLQYGPLAVAGAVAGLAAGLKLTALPFAAAIGLLLLLLLGLRAALAAGAAMVLGFLLGFGPFAWQLWQTFGNPMFPLYNHIFQSPDWLPVATADERFLPRSTLQALFYPFWWLEPTVGLVSELRLRDPRLAIAYVAWVVVLAMVLCQPRAVASRPAFLLLGVTALSYAAWAKLFGIYRYLVFLEALGLVVAMLALAMVRPARPWPAICGFAVIAAATIAFTIYPNWGHGPHGARLLEAEPLPVQPGSLVVAVDASPVGYLVTLMPPDVRVLGLLTNITQPGHDHGLNRRMAAAIAAHAGPIWSLSDSGTPENMRGSVLAAYGLSGDGACVLVRTSFEPGGHRFCPVRKPP